METGEASPDNDVETGPAAIPALPVVRAGIGGVLMGLANLVPGVSGGTMILVMGLYDEFIGAIADVTRLKLTRRNLTFLAIVGFAAAVAIAALAGTLRVAVTEHRSAMFSLFIGLTFGGAPLLVGMIGRFTPTVVVGLVVGLGVMLAIALTEGDTPDKDAIKSAIAAGEFVIQANYGRDLFAGVLGMSAMVLPGISGAYMLLIVGRYETILAAIDAAKRFALSGGKEGAAGDFLQIIIPTGIGALVSLVLLSNLLKWMLRHHEPLTLGALLGILLGSVVGIWPFDAASQAGDYGLGAALAVGGFLFTLLLSRIGA